MERGLKHILRGMQDFQQGAAERASGANQYLRPPASGRATETWEYAVVQVPSAGDLTIIRGLLEDMGRYGWELVYPYDSGVGQLRGRQGAYVALFFKRLA